MRADRSRLMRFTHTIPDPETIIAGKEGYHLLEAGALLDRLHHSDYRSAQFNPSDRGNARFSPIRNSVGEIIPTIYVAQSFECAVCEIILRCPDTPSLPSAGIVEIVQPNDYANYRHSRVELTAELKLLDLTTGGQRRIGVNDNVLLAGPRSTYPSTRAWAEKIHATFPDVQGLYYLSYQYGPHFAAVLFGDRIADGVLRERDSRAVSENPCHDEIVALAGKLSIEYANV